MKKILIITLVALLVTGGYSACQADEFHDGANCVKCSLTGEGKKGIANCAACTLADKATTVTCTACSGAFYLSENSCKGCHESCATCSGSLINNCLSCSAGKFLKDATCNACSSSCATCETGEVLNEDKSIKQGNCKTCAAKKFLNSADTTCQSCSASCASCEKAEELNVDKSIKQGNCKTCDAKQFLNSADTTCKACSASCASCDKAEELNEDKSVKQGNCKTCDDGKFVKAADTTCAACGSACATCSSATACSKCTTDKIINFPADGTCVASCAKGTGTLADLTTKVCSEFAAPVKGAIAVGNVTDNKIKISSFCSGSSTSADDKKRELVGVVGCIYRKGVNAENPTLALRKGVTTDVVTSGADKIFFNINGNEGAVSNFEAKIFRGDSTLKYICVNKDNVISEVVSIDIKGNATLNKAVNFRVTFSRALNESAGELNAATCAVAKAIFGTAAGASDKYPLLVNSNGKYCDQPATPATRILQAAAGDYYFTLAASQIDDTQGSNAIAKVSDINTALTKFAEDNKFKVSSSASAIEFDPSLPVPTAAPVPKITQVAKTASNITVSVTSDSAAVVYLASGAQGSTPADVLAGTGAFEQKSFNLAKGESVNHTLTQKINASSTIAVHYKAVSSVKPTLQSAIITVNVTSDAAGSFSSILSLSCLLLIVLAFLL